MFLCMNRPKKLKSSNLSHKTINYNNKHINDENQTPEASSYFNNVSHDNNNQPETLQYLDDYILEQENYKPTSFFKRLAAKKAEKMRPVVETFLKELVQSNEFCRQVKDDESTLSNIMAEHFKNQFETNNSSGALNYNFRKKVASTLFGIPQNVINNMLGKEILINEDKKLGIRRVKYENGAKMEKYGYLSKKDRVAGNYDNYGDIKFIFNKNSLINRTTITVGDSLQHSNEVIATRASNPKIECIPGVKNRNYKLLKTLYNLIKRKKINSSMNASKITNIVNGKYNYSMWEYSNPVKIEYFELQFHGSLTKNDISECRMPNYINKNVESIISDNNIPIFRQENIHPKNVKY